MSEQNILGRQLRPVEHKRLCDLEAEGHNKIIMPGKVAYQVVQGKSQGIFHGPGCYHKAREHYEQLEKQVGLDVNEEE